MQESIQSKKQLTQKFRCTQSFELIQNCVCPENKLESKIINDPSWIKGAFWGVPRPGHPEGKVIYHIKEVLDNVNQITTDSKIRADLRLITIIHDTFKYLEETVRPRTDWSKHHAVYARHFAAKFINKAYLLDIIELHDEAYYAWCHWIKGRKKLSERRMNNLLHRIGTDYLQLFYLFFKCDTQTGDKIQTPIHWFENNIPDIEIILF